LDEHKDVDVNLMERGKTKGLDEEMKTWDMHHDKWQARMPRTKMPCREGTVLGMIFMKCLQLFFFFAFLACFECFAQIIDIEILWSI
jgi:hypothetical protein